MPKTSEPQLLLLDTHCWLWLVAGSPELSPKARQTINRAAAAGELRIAAISLWEIALLAWRGRIVLSKSIGLWLEEALAEPGLPSNRSVHKLRSKAARCRLYFIPTRPTG